MTRSLRPLALLLALAAAAVGLAACGSGDGSAEAAAGGIRLTDATVDRPINPDVTAVRLRVHNDGAEADELVGVSSEVARSSMVHRSTTDAAGRSTMEMVAGLEIPARSTVTFEPGGLHVMLDGLRQELALGDRVEVTFVFRDAGSVTTTAEVVEPGTQDLGTSAGDGEEAGHDH